MEIPIADKINVEKKSERVTNVMRPGGDDDEDYYADGWVDDDGY